MHYSEKIRIEMARQNLTDAELAALSGVSRPIIADIRNGEAKTIEPLQKVANALGISLDLTIVPFSKTQETAKAA